MRGNGADRHHPQGTARRSFVTEIPYKVNKARRVRADRREVGAREEIEGISI